MTSVGSASGAPISPAARSPWHSPVPYLFGGLAAMLGLIAFALLILACSYWKLSGFLESEADRDLEAGESDGDAGSNSDEKPALVYEPKFLVIMAGQEKPTCLATPASSRTSSFGSNGCENKTMSVKGEDLMEKRKEGSGDQVRAGNLESHGPSDQVP
ncbi:hypothetical protein LguiA_011013 [Lonicera macranthoides]